MLQTQSFIGVLPIQDSHIIVIIQTLLPTTELPVLFNQVEEQLPYRYTLPDGSASRWYTSWREWCWLLLPYSRSCHARFLVWSRRLHVSHPHSSLTLPHLVCGRSQRAITRTELPDYLYTGRGVVVLILNQMLCGLQSLMVRLGSMCSLYYTISELPRMFHLGGRGEVRLGVHRKDHYSLFRMEMLVFITQTTCTELLACIRQLRKDYIPRYFPKRKKLEQNHHQREVKWHEHQQNSSTTEK